MVNLFSFIAEEVREILAELGFRKLEDVIGRTDLLFQKSRGAEELDDLDLNPLLVQADPGRMRASRRWRAATKCPIRWTRRSRPTRSRS